MIKSFTLENFGTLKNATANDLSHINLLIGENFTGKTFLLKALYAMIRTQEEARRGNDNRSFNEVLRDKLYGTFQTVNLGSLVNRDSLLKKGTKKRLKSMMVLDDNSSLSFDFGKNVNKKVNVLHNDLCKRDNNSIFIQSTEVLSLSKIVIKSALHDKTFGFDDTYVDLVLALQNPFPMDNMDKPFTEIHEKIRDIIQGKIEFDATSDSFMYRKDGDCYSMYTTSDGIKKFMTLDILLRNRYISPGSIVFIDELESHLHPSAINVFLDIVELLSEHGVQFFISSNSYFVIRKLHLVSLKTKQSLPILIAGSDGELTQYDLLDDIPKNSIVGESINLSVQEMELENC